MVVAAYKMEDNEKEAFKLIKSQPDYVWLGRVIEFLLAYSGFDPFASIKAYRNRTSGWKLGLTKRWLRLSILLSVYLSIKTLTIITIRSTVGSLDIEHDEQLISKLQSLQWLLGDPYSIPPLPSTMMYIMFPLVAVWIKCYMPVYTKTCERFDCSIARFILEPEEEIRQFDLQASQLLKVTSETVEHQRWILSRDFRLRQRSREDLELFCSIQNQTHRQLSLMREIRHKIHLVRPKVLRPEWHQLNRRVAPILSALMTVILIAIAAVIFIHFNSVAWNGRCARLVSLHGFNKFSRESHHCRLLDAFSYSDLLVMLEIELSFVLFAQIPGGMVVAFLILQTAHQLFHTCNLAQDLHQLLADLRSWNASQPVAGAGAAICDRLSRRLCTNIVRVRMFERESRKSVSALSHGTRLIVAFCLFYTACVFASIRLHAPLDSEHKGRHKVDAISDVLTPLDMEKSTSIVLVTWMIMTLQLSAIQVACASIPSQIAHIDKLIYSLMAQLIRIQQMDRTANYLEQLRAHDHSYPVDDPITSLWRRQVFSRKSNSDRTAVRVFGTKFTYERVLTLQFYYATIISLLYSFIK